MFRHMIESLIGAMVILAMPDWTGSPVNTANISIQFKAAGGDQASVNLGNLNNAVVSAQAATLRAALGNVSNAVPIGTTYSQIVAVPFGQDAPYDESYSGASDKMVLQFQSSVDLSIRSVAIPAPDETFFGADGIVVIARDAAGAAGEPGKDLDVLVALLEVIFSTGPDTVTYLGGYRASRSRALRHSRTATPSIEPLAAPGVGPGA